MNEQFFVTSPDDEEYLNACAEIIHNIDIPFTEERMFDLLQIKKRWGRGSLESINHCGRVSDSYYDGDGCLDFYKWKQIYDLGFTTHITDILDLTEELRELDRRLFDLKGSRTVANLYFTKGSTSRRVSFPPHNHDYHVIVKPLYGSCLWQVGEETKEYGPGDLIMVPYGTVHCVHESKELRLSLTVNLTG